MQKKKLNLSFSKEVLEAKSLGKKIVGLESTVLTHGLKWPDNYNIYKRMSSRVRECGAVPACLAVIEGTVKIGLSELEAQLLCEKTSSTFKTSSFDLAFMVSQKKTAGTTVAASLYLAKLAEIEVLATGGIGGVHRGFCESFDISQDLQSLKSSSSILVCSGAKSILDLKATVEALETYGVLSVGYNCQEFPAFYSQKSGIKLSYSVSQPQELWNIFKHMDKGSLLVLNPVAKEFEVASHLVEDHVKEALFEAQKKKVCGKALTPFLLSFLNKACGQKLLSANLALLEGNARLAGEIACQKV